MILPLGPAHVPSVARLHCASLTGLLSRLGPAAARAYYRGCSRTRLAIGLVEVADDGTVRGFIQGSVRPDLLRSEVVRRNPAGTVAGMLLGALRRPSSLAWLLRSLRGPDEGGFDARVPELTYLAVAPDGRGAGVGRALVEAFVEALRGAGATACELSVDQDNQGAIAFYERLGFREVGVYREFGIRHRRYRVALARAPAPPDPSEVARPGSNEVPLLVRLVRYGVAGLLATILYFVVAAGLVELGGVSPVGAAAGATLAVILGSYVVNRSWVFDTTRPHASAFARFVAASGLSMALNTGLMYLAVHVLAWPYPAGLALAALVVPPTNFVVNYLWAFGPVIRTGP